MSDSTEPHNPDMRRASMLADLIRERRTFKVLCDSETPVTIGDDDTEKYRPIVLESIRAAGWAPFHYDRGVDGLVEPWRAHVLWHPECQAIASKFYDWFDDVKPGNKLPAMLSACGALVLVNWIPQFGTGCDLPDDSVPPEKQRSVDEEHLAATASMVQNLLLLLTSYGMGTYWSSGGQFRTTDMFGRLGIDTSERLLAAVFVEFPDSNREPIERVPGKLRDRRCPQGRWIRVVDSI